MEGGGCFIKNKGRDLAPENTCFLQLRWTGLNGYFFSTTPLLIKHEKYVICMRLVQDG